jgi:hypothetical protein
MGNTIGKTKMNPDGEMEEVVWVPIKGYEEFYAINQFGDIKCYPRISNDGKGNVRHLKEKLRIASPHKTYGDRRIKLSKETVSVRRLVAEAFLDFDRSQTTLFVHNERNAYSDYYKHLVISPRSEFFSESVGETRKKGPTSIRPIHCITSSGKDFVFGSISLASTYFDINVSAISKCLNRGTRDILGNSWSDLDEDAKKKFGLVRRGKNSPDDQIISSHKSGMSNNWIRLNLRVSRFRIKKVLRKYLEEHPEEERHERNTT